MTDAAAPPAAGLLLDALAGLPWLAPSADALAALARPRPWESLRHDPAAVLLLLRGPSPHSLAFPLAHLHDPAPLEFALARLAMPPCGQAGWDCALRPIHEACWTVARLCLALAKRTGRADPLKAWCAGLLAPAGWLAVAAVDPALALDCWADPALGRDPLRTQERRWGTSAVAITRRLSRLWSLPAWLSDAVGKLDLPAGAA